MVRIGSNGRKQQQSKPQPKISLSLVTVSLSIAIFVYFGTILYSLSHLDSIGSLSEGDGSRSASTSNAIHRLDDPAVSHSPQQPSSSSSQQFLSQDYFRRLQSADSAKFPITAYTEPPLNDTVPGTGSRGDMSTDKDHGTPPHFITPLPLRTHNTPDMLRPFVYPHVKTCHDMPHKLPVDRGVEFDPRSGETIVRNVGSTPLPPDYPLHEALAGCPVELDPFLPWIHDVFPSRDATVLEFIAQNKRRCKTGKDYTDAVDRLVPQVALLQPVSVQRVPKEEPEQEQRYRLSSIADAAPDGRYTRFLCRFHVQGQEVKTTLSIYPFHYEAVAFRKAQNALLTPKGKDSKFFWTSNLHFQCPIPESLQPAIAHGWSVLDDDGGTPTVFVDVIPLRTSARYGLAYHMDEKILGPGINFLDADAEWGRNHVLPTIAASGRWANIPVCKPPMMMEAPPKEQPPKQKKHYLSACIWASAEYKTRGKSRGSDKDSETAQRIAEWIEFHLLAGFDHFYVYDNSGAHSNTTNLASALAPFGTDVVTRIEWPFEVCNNNIPAHDSTGERSSQYAAENSCLTRYGSTTEWMASFDTDEYFVPMGDYTSLKDVLRDVKDDTNVLSFRSARGKLRRDKSVDDGKSVDKAATSTFLEAYNCDSGGTPKPSWADRARKQIYRTKYVLYHYVHYSTVTKGLAETYEETLARGGKWQRRFNDRSQRVSNEVKEAVMIHSKSIKKEMTNGYQTRCRFDYEKKWQGCWVGVPHPKEPTEHEYDEDGLEYNCFINEKVDNYWVPKLRAAIEQRKESAVLKAN